MNFTIKQFFWAVLSFAIYTLVFDWKIAVMLILGIGFHECSHLYAAKKLGLETKGFYLIPFVGGVALIEGLYISRREHAIVAIAGPIGGGALALVVAGLHYFTDNQFLGQVAVWMLIINLFNLLPLSFLDGGQLLGTIAQSIGRTVGFVTLTVSTLVGIVAAYYLNFAIMIIMMMVGFNQVMREYQNWKAYRAGVWFLCDDKYLNPPKKLSVLEMVQVSLCWFVLAVSLISATVVLYKDTGNELDNLFPKKVESTKLLPPPIDPPLQCREKVRNFYEYQRDKLVVPLT